MSNSSRWSTRFPPPSTPRRVEGGLKARSRRGAIAQTWWSERFIEVLESFGVGSRLQRGRHYARRGQVLALEVEPGSATAKVQGSRSRPYRVRIGLRAYGKAEWNQLEDELADDAWYLSQLLSGEIPKDIEDVFDRLGLPLFPSEIGDLSLDCSCPDREVPCKHLAAVCYLLAEAFDQDPFTILAWRGREREDLLANLQAARSGAVAADVEQHSAIPLEERIETFFDMQAELPAPTADAFAAEHLLDQLPELEVRLRGKGLHELLKPAYQAIGSGAETGT